MHKKNQIFVGIIKTFNLNSLFHSILYYADHKYEHYIML